MDVKRYIDNLNITKATGLDDISPKVLKSCSDVIAPYIAYIINRSVDTGIFPDSLKEARVTPLFKSGDKDDLGNYRPISILPTLSKLFERHIADQIHLYFKETNIIHQNQSGFRRNHSSHTALLRLIESWLRDIDNGKMIGAVFLDLRKAFDLVDHQILLHKLKLYHFSEKSIQLFKSYLSNRRQLVKVGNLKSNYSVITSGVPQGSILGPLLFLLYINDLSDACPTANTDLYADDSTLHKSGFSVQEIQLQLQHNLNNISDWCAVNNMSINPSKTTCMLIGSPFKINHSNKLELTINSTILENKDFHNVLGVLVDKYLSWKYHIEYVCRKLNSKIALLKGIINYLTEDMKQMFYNAYILPILDYCCIIWGKNTKGCYINKVFVIQKRIIKILLHKPKRTPTIVLFKESKLLTFYDRCNYHTAVLVYKIMHNTCPSYMNDLIAFAFNVQVSYNLRCISSKNLSLRYKHNSKYFMDTFSYYSMQVWNNVPLEIKLSRSLNTFKEKLKLFYISQ